MAGNIERFANTHTELALERPHGREADRHQSGLRVSGEHQLVGWAFEDQARELFAERFIDLLEDLAR